MIGHFNKKYNSGLRGFTLVELMCVVAIIGGLASTALPAFNNYLKRAKTIEALTALKSVYQAEVTYYYSLLDKANRIGGMVFDPNAASCGNFTTGPLCHAFTYTHAYSSTGGIGTPPPGGAKELLRLYPDPNGAGASYDANPHDWFKSFPTIGVDFSSKSAFAYSVYLGVPEVAALTYIPTRFSYLSFHANAYGDLDADGVRSNFRRIGYIDKDREVVGGGGVFIDNGIE